MFPRHILYVYLLELDLGQQERWGYPIGIDDPELASTQGMLMLAKYLLFRNRRRRLL